MMGQDESDNYAWKEKIFHLSCEQHNRLDDKLFQSSLMLAKTIITLSGGTLALSMTLMKEFIAKQTAPWMLRSAWIFFGLTIVTFVGEILISNQAIQAQIKINDNYYNKIQETGDHKLTPEQNSYYKAVLICDIVGIVLFLLAFIFLALFVL